MKCQYEQGRLVNDLDEPYPNSVLHHLSPDLISEIVPDDEPEPITAPQPGFWRRQFSDEATPAQRKFDWWFGVVMPAICFYFDPIVFRGGFGNGPYIRDYSTFACLLSYAAVMATVAVLVWDRRPAELDTAIAGLLTVSGVVSLIIGILLLPLSVLGLGFFFIGVLGFTPFLSAVVFLRNASRANNKAMESSLEPSSWTGLVAFSAAASLVVPYMLNGDTGKNLAEQLGYFIR